MGSQRCFFFTDTLAHRRQMYFAFRTSSERSWMFSPTSFSLKRQSVSRIFIVFLSSLLSNVKLRGRASTAAKLSGASAFGSTIQFPKSLAGEINAVRSGNDQPVWEIPQCRRVFRSKLSRSPSLKYSSVCIVRQRTLPRCLAAASRSSHWPMSSEYCRIELTSRLSVSCNTLDNRARACFQLPVYLCPIVLVRREKIVAGRHLHCRTGLPARRHRSGQRSGRQGVGPRHRALWPE